MRIIIFILLFITQQGLFPQNTITLSSQRNTDNSYNINYLKSTPGSCYLILNFTNYENTLSPQRKFIIKNSSGLLMKLSPINRNEPVRYSYTYLYKRGIPNPKVDTSFVYLLPFKNNSILEVRYLSNLGAKYFDKVKPETWKSFQFISNKPDTVCSARKGVVVNVIDNYELDTTHVYSFSSKRNLITIEHSDGTFAKYQGLNGDNVFVKEGDVVLPNQPLGTLIRYDKTEKYQLRFFIDYLTEKSTEGSTENKNLLYEYLDPYFLTSEGVLRLKPRKKITTIITEKEIIKELNKKEMKKRLKK